jgi:hypothetical protein
MSKVGSHDPFGHLKHKLWPKEGPRIKLAVWLPTTKSQESTRFPCVQVACDTPLKSSQQGIQLCLRPHPNWRFAHKVIAQQSHENSDFGNFETPICGPGTKSHFDVGFMERHIVYYKGEGVGFPQVQAVVSLVSPSLLVARPSIKSAITMH